jgi:hypothetical protein
MSVPSTKPTYNTNVHVAPKSVQSTYTIDNISITPNPFVDKSITDYLQLMASGFYAAKGNLANIVFEYTGMQNIKPGRVLDAGWEPTGGILWDSSSPALTFVIQPNTGVVLPLVGIVDEYGYFFGQVVTGGTLGAFGSTLVDGDGVGLIEGSVYVEPYNNISSPTQCLLKAKITGTLASQNFSEGDKIEGRVIFANSSLTYVVKCVSYSVGNGGLYDFSNQINPQDQFVQTALNSLVESGLGNAPIKRLTARYVFTF